VRASVPKVAMFLAAVTIITVLLGTLMFLVEGPHAGFTSIPKGMYWAVATLTTVGYGDVVPSSTGGRVLASIVMVLGYGVIAVPVGIVSSDIAQTVEAFRKRLFCQECGARGHASDSRYCRVCGGELVMGAIQPSSGNWPTTPKDTDPGANVRE
jgi:voltage-gated potassium channel